MTELVRRLLASPGIAAEILLASLFANLLALASPLFVIQVLNRYVSYGVDATLATLTTGVLIAVALEFAFRHARHLLAERVIGDGNRKRATGAFGLLLTARRSALDRMPAEHRRATVQGLDAVESALTPANTAALMDIPFAVVFIAALTLLHPLLGIINLIFVGIVLVLGMVVLRLLREPQKRLSEAESYGQSLVASTDLTADTIRAFNGQGFMMDGWSRYLDVTGALRRRIGGRQALTQSLTQTAQATMGVAIIGTGATLVVAGELDVGSLIGANILAARALGPVARLAQLSEALTRAGQALKRLHDLADLPVDKESGSALKTYSGRLATRDLSFAHEGTSTVVFDSLSFDLDPGSVLLVRGRNGAGKTTLARLLIGLLEPARGQVLADGVDLRQLDPAWWRRQVCYLPQEPRLLNGTLLDNLRTVAPEIDESRINSLVRAADLGRFVDESADGLRLPIFDNGRRLATGIRKRIALARALAADGPLVVFDDPTEGLDAQGRTVAYRALKDLADRGRTLVVISDDPVIGRGARRVLDLDAKPGPKVVQVQGAPPAGPKSAESATG